MDSHLQKKIWELLEAVHRYATSAIMAKDREAFASANEQSTFLLDLLNSETAFGAETLWKQIQAFSLEHSIGLAIAQADTNALQNAILLIAQWTELVKVHKQLVVTVPKHPSSDAKLWLRFLTEISIEERGRSITYYFNHNILNQNCTGWDSARAENAINELHLIALAVCNWVVKETKSTVDFIPNLEARIIQQFKECDDCFGGTEEAFTDQLFNLLGTLPLKEVRKALNPSHTMPASLFNQAATTLKYESTAVPSSHIIDIDWRE